MDQAAAALETINLEGDGDDVDLIIAIEGSFGVQFGDRTAQWSTVGDIYDALVQRVPTSADAGLCATSMAFYRLRAVLKRAGASGQRLTPQTTVAGLTPLQPKTLLSRLSQELGVRPPPLILSGWGCLGFVCLGVGLFAVVAAIIEVQLWPWVLLLPVGFILMRNDKGMYGSTTVGDLARAIAVQNFAHFANLGADRRPATLWRSLCEVVAAETDVDALRLHPTTRLLSR